VPGKDVEQGIRTHDEIDVNVGSPCIPKKFNGIHSIRGTGTVNVNPGDSEMRVGSDSQFDHGQAMLYR
jgi:hypothetical protein